MLLPVTCGNACVLDGVATVDHHVVANIDADVGCTGCIVGSLEENQITGLRIRCRYSCTDAKQTACAKSAHIPANTTVVQYPGYKAGAVKRGRG